MKNGKMEEWKIKNKKWKNGNNKKMKKCKI